MKTPSLLLVAAIVASCASPSEYLAHNKARAELQRFEKAEFWSDVDLVNPGQLTRAQQDAEVTARAPQLEQCLPAAETGLLGMRLARSKLDMLHRAHDIDARFDECVRRFGLTGRINFKVGDDYLTFPEFIEQGTRAAEIAAAAGARVNASQQDSALTWAYGLSIRPLAPSTVYVTPHVRSDGSFVRGHVRTTPDRTCLNNIGGCR